MPKESKTIAIPSRMVGGKKYYLLDSAANEEHAHMKVNFLIPQFRYHDMVFRVAKFKRKGKIVWGVWGRFK